MASVREQILAYIVTQLEAVSGLKDRVHRSRQVPSRRDQGLQVLVEPVEEEVTPLPAQRYERQLTLRISIRTYGLQARTDRAPETEADATAVAIFAKLNGTDTIRRMGGLAITPIVEAARTFPMEDADGNPIDYQMTFVVTYRTTLTSEETVG